MPHLEWVDDDEDIAMAARGGPITFAAAARHAQRDVRWVHRSIASGQLQTIQRGGRAYVDARSLAQLLARDGVGFGGLEKARLSLLRQSHACNSPRRDSRPAWIRFFKSRTFRAIAIGLTALAAALRLVMIIIDLFSRQ